MKAILISFDIKTAFSNMETDLSLMERASSEEAVFLRFYKWKNKTISFGKFQKVDCKIQQNLRNQGFDIVFRPSGGRAVIHHNDITYCFTAPLKFFSSKDTKSIYRKITFPIIKSLQKYTEENIDITRSSDKKYFSKESCFSSLSLYEISVEGKKILGSAQYKTCDSVLQHGTFYYDYPDIPENYLENYVKNIKTVKIPDVQKFINHTAEFYENELKIKWVSE
ncbi:MAG: hypothetical protein WC002_01590 [Candidatus Muiribacteriota bacterium]|jgi:lipoate-protein ligase A